MLYNRLTLKMTSKNNNNNNKQHKNIKLRVCLGFTYFAKIEKFLLKVLQIKVKINWNNIVSPMNSTKNYNGTHE